MSHVEPNQWLSPLTDSHWNYRRRARLSVKWVAAKDKVLVGFREKNGRFVADMNQLDVHAAQMPELSALGAVFCGCLGLKIYTSLDELEKLPSGFTEYGPSMSPARAGELYAGWQTAVQQVLYQPTQG